MKLLIVDPTGKQLLKARKFPNWNVKIAKQLGNKAMNRTRVIKWRGEFKSGRTSVNDDQRSGRPSIVKKIENALRNDCWLTVDELSAMFPQIYRSLLHETNTETLGYRNCAWGVFQTSWQTNTSWIEWRPGKEFLRHYKLLRDDFLQITISFLKLHMDGKRFLTDEEVKGEVEKWTKELVEN